MRRGSTQLARIPGRHLAPFVLPLLATTLTCVAFSGRRAIWLDEAVTVWTSTLRFDDFIRAVTGHSDAVQAVYYLAMRPWIAISGHQAWVLRLPSALFMVLACGGVLAIANRLGGARLAMLSGLTFSVLPAVFDYGTEARPYAASVALSAWTTFALLGLLGPQRPRRRTWLVYTCLLTLSGYVFLFSWIMSVGHLATAALVKTGRVRLRALLAAQGISLVLLGPLIYLGASQRGQVGWLTRSTWTTIAEAPFIWFGPGPRPATFLLGLLIWGVLVSSAYHFIRAARRWPHGLTLDPSTLSWPWLVLPPALLILASFAVPVYLPRYVLFTTPALALLLGQAWAQSSRPRVLAAVVSAALVLTGLTFINTRLPAGRDDWGKKLAILTAHASPGDSVLASPRYYAVVGLVTGLPDLKVLAMPDRPAAASTLPGPATVPFADRPPVVWLVPYSDRFGASQLRSDVARLRAAGYVETAEYPAGNATVYRYALTPAAG